MRLLTLMQVVEYYDIPQVFVANDAMGTSYLCTLYSNTEEGYKYIGVQLSEPRLLAFLGGQLDLRDAYQYPEAENAVYLVKVQNEMITAEAVLLPDELKEEMLPEAGFFVDVSDFAENGNSESDTYQLEVPVHDRITFSTLVSRMGWKAALHKTTGKVAVL